jgi:hypothetical protein
MTEPREKKVAEIQDSIRQILYRDWDPIGVSGTAPKDEYDSYIGGVYRILATSRSEEALVEFLSKIESDLASSDPASRARLVSVVNKLLALNVKL